MTKEILSALLNGRQYGNEITMEEEADARDAGLVIALGADDCFVELHGAIDDLFEDHSGVGSFRLDREGIKPVWGRGEKKGEAEAREYLRREASPFTTCTVIPSSEGYSWVLKIDIPYAPFDIMKGDRKYCRSIVFGMADMR